MKRYVATTTQSNKRVEFTAKSVRAAKMKAYSFAVYADDIVSLYEYTGGAYDYLIATKHGTQRWVNSLI